MGCTVKDWTDCQIVSLTGGWGFGIGVKGQLGPVEIKGDLAKTGVEGSLSLTVSGHVEKDIEGTASAFSGSVRAGSRELEVSAVNCGTKSGCHVGTAGLKHVEAAPNGDVSVKAKVGIELGITVHVGQLGTAIAGAATDVYTMASGWIWKHVAGPYGTAGSNDVPR